MLRKFDQPSKQGELDRSTNTEIRQERKMLTPTDNRIISL